MKQKIVAALLALFFGIFGVHRFYLGKRFQGVLHLLLFFITFAITVEEDAPFIMAPAILGFIDAVLLFVMPDPEFERRYNKEFLVQPASEEAAVYQSSAPRRRQGRRNRRRYSHTQKVSDQSYKKVGIQYFRNGDYQSAIQAFEQYLELTPDDPSTHFNLACCYSLLQESAPAYFHLQQAVEKGFDRLDKIRKHFALKFLRQQPDFKTFELNGYFRPTPLPEPKPNFLDQQPTGSTNILDQLLQLGDLREKGLITEEEFRREKKKLLD